MNSTALALEAARSDRGWPPDYELGVHGEWFISNVWYPGGHRGCVSNTFPDGLWRIIDDPRDGHVFGGLHDLAYKTRDEAAQAQRDLIIEICEQVVSAHEILIVVAPGVQQLRPGLLEQHLKEVDRLRDDDAYRPALKHSDVTVYATDDRQIDLIRDVVSTTFEHVNGVIAEDWDPGEVFASRYRDGDGVQDVIWIVDQDKAGWTEFLFSGSSERCESISYQTAQPRPR